MALHRILTPQPLAHTPTIVVAGEEAHHAARVKRLEAGDRFEALDGQGGVALCRVREVTKTRAGDWEITADLESLRRQAPIKPALHVMASTPKGERAEELVDQLSQAGAASWAPLTATRTVVEPRSGKLDRLARIAREAAKQSGRAWALRIDPPVSLDRALQGPGAVVLADQSGEPYKRTAVAEIVLLIGPEGGWTDDELARARTAGAAIARFGPLTMRVETAAVIAAAIVLNVEAASTP